MNSKNLIVIAVLLIILVGGYLFISSKKPAPSSQTIEENMQVIDDEKIEQTEITDTADVTLTPEVTDAMSKTFTLEEIAKHSSPTDCWFAIEGKVYDVTKYIAAGLHPGEDKILLGCGKDATTLFATKAGKNQDHSAKARGFLTNWLIGELGK